MNSHASDDRDALPEIDGRYLFGANSYTEWGRRVVRLRDTAPEVTALFDSTINEPTAELVDVVRHAFAAGMSPRYASVFSGGNPFALRALAARYGLRANQIIRTTGAMSGVAMALKALVRAGDEVLVERPGFSPHLGMITDLGATPVSVDRLAPSYGVDLDAIEAKLTPRTRAMVITNLHNPTGVYLPSPEIKALAERLAAAGCVFIVDEIYADFAEGAAPAARLGRNVISVSSLTKVYGLFSLKFGWLAADEALIAEIQARLPDGDMGVSKLTHALAAHVLEAPEPFELHWKRTLEANRPLVLRAADAMKRAGTAEGDVPPFGCMYFPRIIGVDDTRELARRLFDEHGVVVGPGEYFGAPGHIRIGFGNPAEPVEKALQRLVRGLAALR